MADPFRVLFLGTGISPLSVAVLDAITATDEFDVTVVAPRSSLPKTVRRTWRDHGPQMVLSGAARMVRAILRARLRRFGLTSGPFLSLGELVGSRSTRVVQVASVNAPEAVEVLSALQPDLLLVAVFGQILKPAVLGVPRLGAVNVHPSLLPAYRGPNPVYWAVANGESRTGVTFHQIDEGIDTGDLLAQREVVVEPGDTESSLRRRCAGVAGDMVVEVVRGLRDGSLEATPQDESQASYFGQPPRGRSRL